MFYSYLLHSFILLMNNNVSEVLYYIPTNIKFAYSIKEYENDDAPNIQLLPLKSVIYEYTS